MLYDPSKCRKPLTKQHCVTSQKTIILRNMEMGKHRQIGTYIWRQKQFDGWVRQNDRDDEMKESNAV
jgi:hypothetical protein